MAKRLIKPSAIRQWKPIRFVEDTERRFVDDLDRFLDDNLSSWPIRLQWRRSPGDERAWAPAAEIYETTDKYTVRVDLPGVAPEDIDISVLGDSLIVKGVRRPADEVEDDQYHRCELCYGNFHRQIGLPSEVDANKIEATYENGMVEVQIPKSKAAKPTKIQIKGK